MKKVIFITILTAITLFAETTHYGRVCLSESEHKEYAVGDGNIRKNLVDSGRCFYMKDGLSCVTLDRGFISGRNKIKVFENGQTYIVYGYMEVCQPK